MIVVLDASALCALIFDEKGAAKVEALLPDAVSVGRPANTCLVPRTIACSRVRPSVFRSPSLTSLVVCGKSAASTKLRPSANGATTSGPDSPAPSSEFAWVAYCSLRTTTRSRSRVTA